MKKNLIPILFIAAMLSGCTTRTITYGDAKYVSKRFLQKEDVDGLKVTTPDGTIIELTGYRNDQVQAISAAVEAAVKATAQSVVP